MKYKIIDNILSNADQNRLEEYMLSNTFPWFLNQETSFGQEETHLGMLHKNKNTYDNPQFTHCFFDGQQQPYFRVAVPFLNYIKNELEFGSFQFSRIKANLLLQNHSQPEGSYNIPHIDGAEDSIKTLLYYVNSSDGDTTFFHQKYNDVFDDLTINTTVKPKKGTAILFESNYFHCSAPPVSNKFRCVINLVFRAEKEIY